jgi:hypothetical protein
MTLRLELQGFDFVILCRGFPRALSKNERGQQTQRREHDHDQKNDLCQSFHNHSLKDRAR